MSTMMTCGCATDAVISKTGEPYCITHDCKEIEESPPDLTGRIARCSCRAGPGCEANARASQKRFRGGEVQYGAVPAGGKTAEAPSSTELPFFQHKPDESVDSYYCGCMGWG